MGFKQSRKAHSAHRVPLGGSVVKLEYKGQMHEVKVLKNGFEHEGQRYRSLSAVTRSLANARA